MLAKEEKKDIKEMIEIIKKLDATGRMLIMSNATVLLARQAMEEKSVKREKILKWTNKDNQWFHI